MSLAKLLLRLLLPLSLAACALGQIGAVVHPTVSGSVDIRTGDVMARWNPDRCVSGDRAYFLGLEFHSSADSQSLRAWREPDGKRSCFGPRTTIARACTPRIAIASNSTCIRPAGASTRFANLPDPWK